MNTQAKLQSVFHWFRKHSVETHLVCEILLAVILLSGVYIGVKRICDNLAAKLETNQPVLTITVKSPEREQTLIKLPIKLK